MTARSDESRKAESIPGSGFRDAHVAARLGGGDTQHSADLSGAHNAQQALERAPGTEKTWENNDLRRHRGGAGRESAEPFCAR